MQKYDGKNAKWLVLFAMAACLSLIFIDQTALPVALLDIKQHLGTSDLTLQWVLNAYLLTIASLIIAGGKIADIVGHRKMFFVGIMTFLFASCLCAISDNSWQLILGRIAQGLGAALMLPPAGVILINAFGFEERGKAMGIYISSASIFLAIGPMLGGVITQYLGWRWIFWLNIPFIFISTLILYCTATAEDTHKKGHLDWLGLLWLVLTIIPFIFALMEGVSLGWDSPIIIGLMVLSILSAVFFFMAEKNKSDPLIDIELFKNSPIRVSLILIMFTQCAIISIAFWPIFLQDVLGFSPGRAGLALLPVTIPVMIISPIAGQLMDKHGPRLPTLLGCLCIGIGALWIAIAAWSHNYFLLVPGIVIYGCGPSFLISSTMAYIMSAVEPRKRGVVAGISNFVRQLGGALGIALIGSVLSNAYALKFANLESTMANSPDIKENAYTFAFSCSLFLIFLLAVGSMRLLKNIPNHTRDLQQ